MKTINMHAAKTQFSSLIEEALSGEDIVIAKAGKPVVRLAPVKEKKVGKTLGMMKGKIRISEDFNAPLPAEILKGFGMDA